MIDTLKAISFLGFKIDRGGGRYSRSCDLFNRHKTDWKHVYNLPSIKKNLIYGFFFGKLCIEAYWDIR
jgi:hypothetical protein